MLFANNIIKHTHLKYFTAVNLDNLTLWVLLPMPVTDIGEWEYDEVLCVTAFYNKSIFIMNIKLLLILAGYK